MQTGKKGLALLLALLMVFSLLPVSALAADGCLTATDAGKTFAAKQGENLTVQLAQYFTDSEGHTLTYTLDNGDYGEHTQIAEVDGQQCLSFTNSAMGTYTPTVTATCSNGETASVQLTITVTEAPKGDENQYRYDESPADSVTVYVTISSDGMPVRGKDGTPISHLEVTVPYFDLASQDLGAYYRYHTENGSGKYVNEKIVERPTALHLYLYMIGVYYLGLNPAEVTTGSTKIVGHAGGAGVSWINGDKAYDDTGDALSLSGSATSMYMENFWGHDQNLMYYRNHIYPLMSAGWGSTADYILLSDGDTIDVAMYSDWGFWSDGGAFARFDQDAYSVAPGGTVSFSTLKYETKSVSDGGSDTFTAVTGMDVGVYDENMTPLDVVSPEQDGGSSYAYTFENAGTYYLMAMDTNCCSTDARLAPATAKVTVGSSSKPFDPAEHYKNFDFASITLDEEGTQYIYNIEESSIHVNHFQVPGDKKLYTVTVPEGTDYVYVNYPADFKYTPLSYCALLDTTGAVTGYDCPGFELLDNASGGKTLKLPVPYLVENSRYFAAEEKSYDYFNCFGFVYGDNTAPGGAVAVTGVTLDKSELSLTRREEAKLTATVEPQNADNPRVSWKSSNTDVATVNTKGVVTGVGTGTATITVTTADGGYTAQCTVTVTDPSKPALAEDGYYEISNAAQLQWFANEVNASKDNAALNARLTDDIDLSGICSSANPWTPIGDHANNRIYSGTFDGQGHKITGLYLKGNASNYTNGNTYYIGLFGECDGVTIKNLSVYGTAMAVTRMVGGLAGRTCGVSTHRRSTVENCHNYVEIKSDSTADTIYGYAGVVASAQDVTIRNCSNQASRRWTMASTVWFFRAKREEA